MPEPTLQSTALRYAARDLTPAESAAFESLLSRDQDARDALAEAVRLSAAALGQTPPAPDRSFRQAIQERLAGWRILRRRAYRGHPVAWVALGAMAVAACTLIGLNLAESDAGPPALTDTTSPASEPALESRTAARDGREPREDEGAGTAEACGEDAQTMAEIWAHLSTLDHFEKVHDEELRWRQKLRDTSFLQSGPSAESGEAREP